LTPGPLDANKKYNEMPNVVQSRKYNYAYQCDEFGNWTTMKIFQNVRGKKKNDRVFKRKFKYGD
jgi:hypothetical protein